MIVGIVASRRLTTAGLAWNPADKGSAITLSENNTFAYKTTTSTSTFYVGRAAAAKSSGKWYFETTLSGAGYTMFGLASPTMPLEYTNITLPGHLYCLFSSTGQCWFNGGNYASGIQHSPGQVMGLAWDAAAGTARLYRGGVYQGIQINVGANRTYTPAVVIRDFDNSVAGPSGYRIKPTPIYTPPAGYLPWAP